MSDSAEFEIESASPFTPSRKRQRVLSLRPRPTESKVAGYSSSDLMYLLALIGLHHSYFAPGGILDSQTTETQWMLQYSPADGQHNPPGIILLHNY